MIPSQHIINSNQVSKILGECSKSANFDLYSIQCKKWKEDHLRKGIELFELKTKKSVSKAHSRIHKKYNFLGATPDGLVDDGLVVMNFPTNNIRFDDISHEKWIDAQVQMEIFELPIAYIFQVKFPEELYSLHLIERDATWFNFNVNKLSEISYSRKRKRCDDDKAIVDYTEYHQITPIIEEDDIIAWLDINWTKTESLRPKQSFQYSRLSKTNTDAIERIVKMYPTSNVQRILNLRCERSFIDSREAIQCMVNGKSINGIVDGRLYHPGYQISTHIPYIQIENQILICHYIHHSKSFNSSWVKDKSMLVRWNKLILQQYTNLQSRHIWHNHENPGLYKEVLDNQNKNHLKNHLKNHFIGQLIKQYHLVISLPESQINTLSINMSNNSRKAKKWDHIKKTFAKQKGELTLLWNVGLRDKKKLIQKGIQTFHTDSRLIADTLYRPTCKTNRNLKLFADNIQNKLTEQWKVKWNTINLSKQINNTYAFIDFETANHYIYLIGIVYQDGDEYKYKFWLAETLDTEGQSKIIHQWLLWHKNKTISRYVHWSAAEKSDIKRAVIKDPGLEPYVNILEPTWYDLKKVFSENNIIIPYQTSFSLKSVVAAMKKINMIKTSYEPSKLKCLDGMEAAAYGMAYYDGFVHDMKGVIEYNKVDCIVMLEIMIAKI